MSRVSASSIAASETAASESFKGVNDLVFAPSGNLYFTDQGQTGMHDPTGRVWKLTPDGRLTLNRVQPSSFGEDVDGELYVCDHTKGNIFRIVAE